MEKYKALFLNTKAKKKSWNEHSLRLLAVLTAVILVTSLFAGCAGSSPTVAETMFQEDAAGGQSVIAGTYGQETEAGDVEQTTKESRSIQTSAPTTTIIETIEPSATTSSEEEVSPAEKAPKPVETTNRPAETTAKPTETTAKAVETTVKPTEPKAICNLSYIPMSSQEKSVADQLMVLLNNYRASKGLAPVAASSGYLKAASVRAREASILFKHTRPDGSDFYTVLEDLGLPFVACGENLASRGGGISGETAQLLLDQWIQSSGHNDNMLKASWKFAGIGISLSEDKKTVYAAQFFAAE